MSSTRYEGTCALCDRRIPEGAPAYYMTTIKTIVHIACADEHRGVNPTPVPKVRTVRKRQGTKRAVISALIELGLSRREIYDELRPLIESQTSPMIYKANVNGRRVAKPVNDQYQELWTDIARKFTEAGKRLDDGSETPDEVDDVSPAPIEDEEPEPEEEMEIGSDEWIESEKRFFHAEVKRLRQFFVDRARVSNQVVEDVSMRPAVYGRRMIEAGIPARACLYAMMMHLAPETRMAAGVEDFDLASISDDMGPGTHKLLGYALKLARARVPIMMIGPKGSGKSEMAKQIAVAMDLPYGECPMTAGATPTWLLGRYISDYIASEFVEVYSGGGVFCFEEMDSADPNMLLVTNNALASDEFHNPISGQKYSKHENFVPIATANTFGGGSNSQYTGRERLDDASLDRWAMGRIFVEVDEELEESILFS